MAEWLASLTNSDVAAGLCIGFFLLVAIYTVRPKRHNRRIGLPPPSDACKRNSTQAVP